MPFNAEPTLLTAVMFTIEMPPAIKAYSMVVTAVSSSMKERRVLIMS